MSERARRRILSLLDGHEPAGPRELKDIQRVRSFVERVEDPMDRDHEEGHVVASGLVASPRLDQVVLMHHRGLDRWLQCGGHAEPGEQRPRLVAKREVVEETGFEAVRPHPSWETLLDVDVHRIPSTDAMPEHVHLDLRFLFEKGSDATPQAPREEAHDVRWFDVEEARRSLDLDEGLQRLLWKVRSLRVEEGFEASDARSF